MSLSCLEEGHPSQKAKALHGLDFDLCFNYGTGECFLFFGMQFDLSVSSESTGISVEAVSLYLNVGTNIQIEFWTKAGEHEGSHNVPEEWDYHSISDAYDLSRVTLVTIPIPPIDIGPGSTQAFYAVLTHAGGDGEGGMLCGTTPAPRVFDNFVEIMSPARVFPTSEPFGEPSFVNFSLRDHIQCYGNHGTNSVAFCHANCLADCTADNGPIRI
ncbi:hypothetical protein ACHAXT_003024 [Thalassiosira profunda]